MSKGSKQRPVDAEAYAANYARIFRTQLPDVQWKQIADPAGMTDAEIGAKRAEYIAKQPNAMLASLPFTELYEDRREALRDKHLAEARDVIRHAPPMSPETRAKIDKTWADFDAAYPQPLDLPPKEPK